jgi:6,7-dimethyl-8-ribityllumazine synthase
MPHFFIAVARFYQDIAAELESGAVRFLTQANATYDVVSVPGAFELPAAIAMAIKSGKYDGYIALGCVIRGETSHYDYVCGESARGLNELAITHHAPIGYGILTVETVEQAWERACLTQGDKGRDAAQAATSMLTLKQTLGLL